MSRRASTDRRMWIGRGLPVALALALLLGSLIGCAGNRIGSRSTWGLWMQENRTPTQHLGQTVRLLDGHNDFSDLARSAFRAWKASLPAKSASRASVFFSRVSLSL